MDLTRFAALGALRDYLEAYAWTTWSPSVHLGRSVFDPDADPLPVLTILPGQESVEPRYGADRLNLPLDVSALISFADGQDLLEDCEAVLAQIKTALFAAPIPLGDHLISLRYAGGGLQNYPAELGPHVAVIALRAEWSYEDDYAP